LLSAAKDLRPWVFWPAFTILMVAVVLSITDLDRFLATTRNLNDAVLNHFGWLFSYGSFYLLLLVILIYLSPLGRVTIGGDAAIPLLTRSRWFFITLCTTLAVGVLFWTTAEPIYHLHEPPTSLAITAGSKAAAEFSLSAMFLHWSFTPYAIYTIPSLVFALAFYNRRLPFSLSSTLSPVFGDAVGGRRADILDTIALYALVTGMASSLGTGAITLVGGSREITGVESGPLSLGVAVAVIVATFVFSAVSGLQRGIARFSAVNALLLLILGLFVFAAGPTRYQLALALDSVQAYLSQLVRLSLMTGSTQGDSWPLQWSVFYWAVWFAWAPIAALFLGRIARGYTVREFIRMNFLFPSLFAVLWISVFSGTTLYLDQSQDGALYSALQSFGPEKMLYTVFDELPLSRITAPLLVFIAYISFVTAADSNTDAIGNLCTRDVNADSADGAGLGAKLLWGTTIGIVSWTMISFAGIDGIRMLSNLGGIAAVTIVLATSLCLWRWLLYPHELHLRLAPAAQEAAEPAAAVPR